MPPPLQTGRLPATCLTDVTQLLRPNRGRSEPRRVGTPVDALRTLQRVTPERSAICSSRPCDVSHCPYASLIMSFSLSSSRLTGKARRPSLRLARPLDPATLSLAGLAAPISEAKEAVAALPVTQADRACGPDELLRRLDRRGVRLDRPERVNRLEQGRLGLDQLLLELDARPAMFERRNQQIIEDGCGVG